MRRSLMLTLITWSIVAVPGLAFAAEGDEQLGGSVRRARGRPRHGPGLGALRARPGPGGGLPPWTPSRGSPARRRASRRSMIIGLALIESLALYVFVIAAILLFVQPVK